MVQQPGVSIIGMGFVGLTLAVFMANKGIRVFGIETNEDTYNKLIKESLLDKFETRYIIFDAKKITDFKKCIYYANVFEVAWLKYIREMYMMSADKDKKRIEMIEERINANKQ